ncbi:MAG: family 43 glycosylhydrolase [Verrucomicrobiae bacterium]|nr:family 43 glycosylhydrolase [Verrucomicrobiae bacterium]
MPFRALLVILALVTTGLNVCFGQTAKEFVNPIGSGADPWVIRDPRPNEHQYLWCSSERSRQIVVSASLDLIDSGTKKIVWRAPDTGPYSKQIWAPELHHIDNRWFIYFAASDGENRNHLAYVLQSTDNDPFGDYELHGPLATGDGPDGQTPNVWAIDMTQMDHNGQRYALWSGWDEPGTDRQFLYIAPMKSPVELAARRTRLCANDDYQWERTEPGSSGRGLNEGPQVLSNGDRTFVVYSCGASWLPSYKLGLLELVGDDPLSPDAWEKHPHPVFESTDTTFGVGHSCFTRSADGTEWWHLFHAKRDRAPGWRRSIFAQPFKFDGSGFPDFGRPVTAGSPLTRPSEEDSAKLQSGVEIRVDGSQSVGTIRALHGGNSGPLQYGGVLDFSRQFQKLSPPLIRLHDCNWPNPDVVDIRTIFANSSADPTDPSSFDFRRTDDYIESIVKTGAEIVYRLGESIEHTPRKHFVHPPADPVQWANVCIGIIRHYNEGWADGHHQGIKYWEIWNEPENKPAMWTGTDAQYLELYAATSKAIKSRWPELKVGGPAIGYTGQVEGDHFEPGEYLVTFLKYCQEHQLPLDFFSWHLYTADPHECVVRARGLRRVLDQLGFTHTELHLNEWNFLPDGDWSPMSSAGQGQERAEWFARIHGSEGAAFTASVLTNLQESPVVAANYYAFTHHGFGLFGANGVPHKPYYAMLAFRRMFETPRRVAASGSEPESMTVLAGLSEENNELRVLIGNLAAKGPLRLTLSHLPWSGESRFEVSVIDSQRNLTTIHSGYATVSVIDLAELIEAPSVGLLKIWSAGDAVPE